MPHRTHVYKMTGSGNDFVFVDGRSSTPEAWPPERIVATCDRRTGVGADGLVVLVPEPHGVRMRFSNADGSRAAMCGNAALCSTRLASRIGLVDGPDVTLETDAGEVRGRCIGDGDAAEIELPPVALAAEVPGLEPGPGERWIRFITVGVPHLVVLVDDLEAIDLPGRGRALRFHPALGEHGANVNFVAQPPAGGRWPIRTYERGVEGETLACGTGTVGSAIALAQMGLAQFPVDFTSRGGFPLSVRARLTRTEAHEVWLQGQGRLVFTATLQE